MRVFSVPYNISYKTLKSKIENEYHKTVTISYEDDEGDNITVRSEDDLEEALGFFTQKGGTM